MARHHESKRKARMHEHAGMERYERGPVKHHSRNRSPERHVGLYHDESYDKDYAARAHERRAMLDGRDHYSGMDARRHQEMRDAGMIHEDPRHIANLPQDVRISYWPKPGGYLPEDLDDTIRGIDDQMDYDNGKKFATFNPKKV